MKMNLFRAILTLSLCTIRVEALILYGLDNTGNLTDPGTGVPYESVARLSNGSGGLGGSGIYLGNGYILTANHVGPYSSITFDGITSYSHDGVAPQQIGSTDMKIFRLSTMPTVGAVQLYTGTSELTASGTLVGWGIGRNPTTPVNSTLVPWGAASTSEKRWGLNTPLGLYNGFVSGSHVSDILHTTVGSSTGTPAGLGASETAATLYDSGSGLFQFIADGWYLTGLTVDVLQTGGGSTSTFDDDLPGTFTPAVFPVTDTDLELLPGSGDVNVFVRVSSYSAQINSLIPEPSSLLLISPTLLLLLRRRRCDTRH